MEYTISWLREPWLLSLIMRGTVSVAEHEILVADQMRYLENANGHLYWIYNLREASLIMSGAVFAAVIDSPIQYHSNVGMLAFVANSSLARFLSTSAIQLPRRTKEQVASPIHVFPSFDEARQFSVAVSVLDPKRATVCIPKDKETT